MVLGVGTPTMNGSVPGSCPIIPHLSLPSVSVFPLLLSNGGIKCPQNNDFFKKREKWHGY